MLNPLNHLFNLINFYDTTGRITACRSEEEGYLDSWQYDAAGNLLDRRAESRVVPFNRITTYRGNHYRYDEFGRTVEKRGRSGTQTYRYDAEHRMVEATTAQGTYRYVYDALGRRTEKQYISRDGKPYTGRPFYGTGCGWYRSAGRREVTACISTATREVTCRWRGWTGRERRNRAGYCIFIRM
ncbi:RHS repeat protein [Salmonella enterica subsp. enterica serovar Ceyco]|nr:RHS repeat protein [Salmonella enterica subsp. enterica serovar Ceyco]